MPGTVLRGLRTLALLIQKTPLTRYWYPHFRQEDTEAPAGCAMLKEMDVGLKQP